MALSNEEIITMVKEKLAKKNRKIQQRDEEIAQLRKKLEALEAQLQESVKKIENREKLIDTIGDILTTDEP